MHRATAIGQADFLPKAHDAPHDRQLSAELGSGLCERIFLIRHPKRVLASYLAKRSAPTADDLGFQRQFELFEAVTDLTGKKPPIIDAHDIRSDPERALKALCATIGISFTGRMLTWPRGGHVNDGPWAPHWYGAAHRSAGFQAVEGPLPAVESGFETILREAMPAYEFMREQALKF